jgi:hypothetical protein
MGRAPEADRQIGFASRGLTVRARDIQQFFRELDRRIDVPVRVVITGGAAAILQGVKRATHDIDFELSIAKSRAASHARSEAVQKAVAETGRVTGITPQYAEDIDRWSAIRLPAKTSLPYMRIGKVDVRILAPGLWAVGKLARFLDSDVADLRTVLKGADTDARDMARLWGRALGQSPTSNALPLFRKQVESFFEIYATQVWGPATDVAELKELFNRTSRAHRKTPRTP